MKQNFQALIKYLTDAGSGEALLKVNIPGQLRPEEDTEEATARNLNAAFLLALSGDENALRYIEGFKENPQWGAQWGGHCRVLCRWLSAGPRRGTAGMHGQPRFQKDPW